MPRLFAYGGTRFSERQRLGSWALSSIEPFNSTTGVPATGFAIGMLWDSGGAALLVRQQQQDSTQRSNVFTLLLDPGFVVWERCSWNAAALAQALFGDGEASVGTILLTRPEEMTQESLGNFVANIGNVSIAPADNPRFTAVWSGAVAEHDLVVVPFSGAGWDAAPTLGSLAADLASLPICFRAGTSWLVGGNRPQARGLNVRLVLNQFEPDPLPLGLQDHGSHLLEAWRLAVEASAELKTLDSQPMVLWNGEAGIVLERAELLASFISQAATSEDALPRLLETLQSPGPAAADIRQAALRFAVSGNGAMTAPRTRFVLALSEEMEPALAQVINGRLDEATTVAYYTADSDGPLPVTFNLPVQWRARIWWQRLKGQSTLTAVIGLLEKARQDLPDDEYAGLVKRIIPECTPPSFLHEWISFFKNHPQLQEKLSSFLQERSLAEMIKVTARSTLSYLAFGNDLGGRNLAANGISRQDATGFVSRLRKEVLSDKSAHAQTVRAWLDAMAESPIRRCVDIEEKLAVARLSVQRKRSRAWRWLRKLEQLYFGKKVQFLAENVPAVERDFLREEFAEMLARPLRHNLPQLRGIQHLLDGIPVKLVTRLSGLPVPAEHAEKWENHLRESGLVDAAERFLAQVALEGRDDGPRRFALRKVDEHRIIEEVARLLRDLREHDSQISAKRLAGLLEGVRGDDLLREKMGKVMRATWKLAGSPGERSREWLLTCLARDPSLFLELASGLGELEQLELLASLERYAPQRMRVESVRAARDLNRGKHIDRRTETLLRFMHSPRGEQLRRVAGADAYEGGAKALDHRLCDMFGPKRAGSSKRAQDRLGMLGKIFGLFHHRPAK